MDSKLAKVRRTFAAQLCGKHKLRLIAPNIDSHESIFDMFINEMRVQLRAKLAVQDAQLAKSNEAKNPRCPLAIQRKQLQKDMEDFEILEKREDPRTIQQITERVEHMAMFSSKYDLGGVASLRSTTEKHQPMVIENRRPLLPCPYQAICSELVRRLKWPSELFAPEYDRCFCKTCYPLTMPNVSNTNNGNIYLSIVPRNWMKFGLKIDEVQAKIHQIWQTWATSYHGTVPEAALSMIKHRQICLPGDTLLDGTQLSIRPGHIPGQKAFFTSPTIRYAAQSQYATALEFTSRMDKCVYIAKIVLRCRQMPGTFTMQAETLNNSHAGETDFCDLIPDEQIEWKTDKRGTVIFDGLCVRVKGLTLHGNDDIARQKNNNFN